VFKSTFKTDDVSFPVICCIPTHVSSLRRYPTANQLSYQQFNKLNCKIQLLLGKQLYNNFRFLLVGPFFKGYSRLGQPECLPERAVWGLLCKILKAQCPSCDPINSLKAQTEYGLSAIAVSYFGACSLLILLFSLILMTGWSLS